MTDAKKFLQKIRLYDTHINTKLEELQHLKEMVTRITPTLKDDVVSSGGGSQDKLGDAVARIVDLEAEINSDVDSYVNAKQRVSKILDQIDDHNQLEVLHKRYVQYETWEKIACEMNMTYRNVCYIHGKALQTVNAMMEKKNE